MKKIFIVIMLLIQGSILSQNNFIRQITTGDFDVRNPFIYEEEFGTSSPIFFELHKENNSNIYYINYNSQSEQFEDTIALTIGNNLNLNPSYHPMVGLIYQTDINGNFDIVLLPDSQGTWKDQIMLTNSIEDEVDPKYYELTEDYFWNYRDSSNMLFKRNNDIIHLNYSLNQVIEETIFHGDSQFTYPEFVGMDNNSWWNNNGYFVFAIEEENSGVKRIVKKYKPYGGVFGEKTILKDSCDCNDLDIEYSTYNTWGLFYTDSLLGQKRYFVIESPFLSNPQSFYLNIEYSGNLSDFDAYRLNIITEKNENYFEPDLYTPYSYILNNQDTTFVRFNTYDLQNYEQDSLYQIHIENPKLAIGPVGSDNNSIIAYTVWEDSIDGHIQLFGTPAHLYYGAVKDESIANNFVLYQNYPNPFNPSTKIEYKLLQASDVNFNVYNIIGEKVFEQNFGYQTPGNYKIKFDGKDMPSGVYVYSIFTNENRLSRKMMLMK